MTYIQNAFHAVCDKSQPSEDWYVCLMEEIPYYGGPEEGGWWGTDYELRAYQKFPSEELANAAKERVNELAKELEEEAQKDYGEQCLRDMEWLEKRGLEADFLPEPDGPSRFYVRVCQELPQNSYGSRHYE